MDLYFIFYQITVKFILYKSKFCNLPVTEYNILIYTVAFHF